MGAPLPPVPGVCSLSMQGTSSGEIWETSIHTQYTGTAPSAANLTSYANNAAASWNTNMSSTQPLELVLTRVVATDLASNTGAQGIWNGSHPGTRGDDPIPYNAAFLISYPSSLRFRGGHFRSYLICGGNADMDGMHWHAAFVNEVGTKWSVFLGNMAVTSVGATSFIGLVGLRRHGKFLPNGGPPSYILNNPLVISLSTTNFIPQPQMASQKGRIGRRSK